VEFLKFLNEIDANVLKQGALEFSLVMDRYGTNNAPGVED
jgi:hypothetical protein